MKGKKYILALLAMAVHGLALAQQATVKVSNNSDDPRQELVEINLSDIRSKLGESKAKKGETYVVKNIRGQQMGSQITHDGKLLIDASVRPHGCATYSIYIGKALPQKVWTTGALYKIRKDDIAWENDRCAYRVYGPALQRTGERSFGIDIWVKNTPDTVVYDRYIKDLKENPNAKDRELMTSYHLDHGNGHDPYRVGATLGLGAPSLIVGKELILPYCYKDYKILDNGPLRFTVELTFNPISVGDQEKVVEHRIISLDKGSNFNKMTVWYEGLTHPTDLATGFPIHEEDTTTKTFAKDYVSYADPTDNPELNNSQVFVAVLFPQGIDNTYYQLFDTKHDGATGHALGIKRNLANNEKYTYCFGAAWSKYDVRNYAEWQLRTKSYLEATRNPLQVTIE